jgi:hypothetical protein
MPEFSPEQGAMTSAADCALLHAYRRCFLEGVLTFIGGKRSPAVDEGSPVTPMGRVGGVVLRLQRRQHERSQTARFTACANESPERDVTVELKEHDS